MSHLINIHWLFWLRLSNLSKCIYKISHSSQIDWSNNTHFMPLVKMYIFISKKGLGYQLEKFERLRILVVDWPRVDHKVFWCLVCLYFKRHFASLDRLHLIHSIGFQLYGQKTYVYSKELRSTNFLMDK